MTLDADHPELGTEQAYVDHAYACLETMLEEVRGMRYPGSDEFEKQAFERFKRIRIAALSDTRSSLVFGRIDERAGETFYIGRHHVRDDRYDTVVVDWRAPVSTAFYRADRRDPMGLHRRRRFLTEGRELLGISDEDLEAGILVDDLRTDEILQRELDRTRGGRMRDVVGTIQAEQDVAIRSPLEGVAVVQGGPGTGKTVVGLHRAAYLLYEHRRRLERTGILVVGPNPVFVRYISEVLPSLGEAAVTQLPIDGLSPIRVRGSEAPGVARLKGEVRMAEVVRHALADRCGTVEEDVALSVRGARFVLPAEDVDAEAARLRTRGVPHRGGREDLRERLLVRAWERYEASLPVGTQPESYRTFTSDVRRDAAFRRALDTVWPSVTPQRLVADLLSSPTRLRRASEGVLTSAERRLLERPRTARGSEEPWTRADGPLIDEARWLIEGPAERYGHIVCDEAQDLSPMELRMLARRCPAGSMTVLGDLGQATGVWAHDDWGEVLEHLPAPDGSRLSELTLGYRVSPAIVDVSARILAEAAPRLRPPVSVRREPGLVSFVAAEPPQLGEAVDAACRDLLARVGTVAVIAPRDALGVAREALREAGRRYGEAERGELGAPVVLVPVDRAKGLEFEAVVVVEPARIAEDGGLRLLYVAVTRAMRELAIVHGSDLPACLAQPVAGSSERSA